MSHALCELVVGLWCSRLRQRQPELPAESAVSSVVCSRSASPRSAPRLEQAVEELAVQVLVAESTVERLDPGVLPR